LQQKFKRKVKLKSERMSWYFIYSTALTGAAVLYVGCLVIVDLYRNYKKKKDTKVEEFKLEQVEETPMTVSESGDGFVVDSGYNAENGGYSGVSNGANGGSSNANCGNNVNDIGYNDGSSNNQNGRNSSDNHNGGNNDTTKKQTQPEHPDQKKGYNDNAPQQNQNNQQNSASPFQSGNESYDQSQQYTSNDKTDGANQSPAPSKAKEKIERINRELVEGDTVSELSCSPSEFAELLMGRGASGLISKPRILIEHNEC
jgi:hypothetical protein